MDPTAVPPPSPEKSPPPQNPHSATDANAIIDAAAAAAVDRHQKAEPSSTSRKNMDSFRALVMKLAGRLLPAHKSLIGRRFDDIFTDELLVPNHPPYAYMILTALRELNTEGGSSKEAISDFIIKKYHELPWAHATMINHHLRDLCKKGKIVMTCDRYYLRCSSITKRVPNSRPVLCLNDDSSCSSSISTPYSSSSASLCSSPSSSSSSFCSGPPYQRRKRQPKRKRKYIKKLGCKVVQGRGRGRGKGRQPRGIQVGQHGGPLGVNQARRRSRPGNAIKIGEKSQMEDDLVVENMSKLEEPKQATEDRNEVMVMEVEEDGIQDGAGKQQNQPQKPYGVTWIGRGKHIQGKGACVKQRESGRKQHVSKRHFQPCEQLEKGINEQGHQRKQYNVVWIGRGVRKLKGTEENLPESESDEKVTELEEHVGEDAVMINCDVEVEEHVEQLKPKEEKREINVEYNRPKENQQSDKVPSVTDDKFLPCEQQERVDSEAELEATEKLQLEHQLCNEVLPEALQVDDRVKDDQYLLMARTGEQEVGVIKEWSGKRYQGEGESMEQIGSQLHQNDLSGEQVDLQKQSNEENDSNFHIQGQPQRESMEQDQLQKQEDHLGDEQNSVMMHCEGQVTDASVKKQHDIEEQPKKGTEEEFETHEQQNGGDTEQKMVEIQVQMVGKPLQDEEIQKGSVLIYEERDALMEKTEPEEQHDCLTEVQVDTKEQSKEHDDVTEEPVHPQEKCIERNEEEIQSCGPDWLKNGEAESAEEQPQQEDHLGDEQNSVMMHCEGQVTDASVEKQHDIEEQPKKGTEEEFETHEQQNGGDTEQKMVEIQVQMVGKPFQDDEIQKGSVLIDEERDALMEKTEPEEQHDCLTEVQVDTKEQSKEHDDVTEEPIHPQEKCIERNEEEIQSCGPDWLKNGEAESAEEQPQQEEQTEANQKETGLAMDSEVQQDLRMNQGETEVGREYVIPNESEERLGEVEVAKDEHRQEQPNKVKEKDIGLMHGVSNYLQDLVMTQTEAEVEVEVEVEGDSEEHNKSKVYQDQLEKRESLTSQVQPQQDGQHKKVLQEEYELMNNQTAVKQDFMMIESESQLENTSVEHNEVQLDDTVVGQVQPQKQLMEETKEGQKDENEAGFEKNQSEERYQPQEQCVEKIEELSQPCIQQTEPSEKDENLVSSSSTIEVSASSSSSKSLGVAKVNLPDHKHQGEQRRPLRQGLRSSSKKEEATKKAKNKLERVTPVRRSLRPRKTISEATVVIENSPDRSKDQLQHSRRARPSKRKPGIAEAEQASKSKKTRKTDL